MTNNTSVTPFDYQGLTDDTQEFVRSRTEEIRTLAQRSAQDIRDIGIKLLEVKGRIGHGRFGIWLKAEFGWSDRTARSFMAVGDRYKTENFSDLTIAPSALYLLSAPSTPKSATDEATKRSKAGEPITHKKAKDIIKDHKPRVVTPPAPPITVSDPDLSWEEQYFEQIDAHSDEVVFMIPGDRATMWVAMGNTARLIAEKTGTQAYPLAGSLPGIQPISMVCVTITDPQTGKQDGQKVDDLEELLGKKTVTYVESDLHLLALLRDTEKRLIDPTPIVQAKHDREAEAQTARQPFAAPIPGMRQGAGATPATPVQFPPTGWRSMVTPVEPVQPAIPLVIDLPDGSENGNGADPHKEPADPKDSLRQPLEFPDTAKLRAAAYNLAGDVPDSTALIDWLAEMVEQMEMVISHFGHQVTTEQDQVDLDVIKSSWHGVGFFGDRMTKMSTLPEKIAAARSSLEAAETPKDCEHVIGTCVQLKVGHEAKDRPVMELMNQAQARLMAIKAAA